MPREFARKHRVADQLKREIGILITQQIKDPRVQLAAITDVDVSPDLKHAKVHVSTFDVTASADRTQEVVDGLRAARGYLKRELGKRLHIRSMPDLRFVADTTERDAQHLKQVIDEAVAEDRMHGSPGVADDDCGDHREDNGTA